MQERGVINLHNRLADHHRVNRWHTCPDGYSWQVWQMSSGRFQATVLGRGGNVLYQGVHNNRDVAEDTVFARLEAIRRG